MAERAADAPRVDALLDRLGDRLSTDAQALSPAIVAPPIAVGAPPPANGAAPVAREAPKRAAVPRPMLGRRPTLMGVEPPSAAPTDPAAPPTSPAAPAPIAAAAAVEAPREDVLERFPAAAVLDAPPEPHDKLELHALEDVATGNQQPDSLAPPPLEGSGVGEPSLPSADAANADAFAEFERGELPNDSTHIEDREALADESTNMLQGDDKQPTLFVEAGKDLGREFTLQEGETAVGRGIDNDIILTDVSVSRKHMRLLCDADGITLIDLGSGNGTTLNGRRIHRALLGDGDRIEIGETVLVTRLPGAKPDLYHQPTLAAPIEATSDERLPSAEVAAPQMAWAAPYPTPHSAAPPPEPTPSRGTSILLGRGTLFIGAALLVVIASMIGAIAMAVLLYEEPVTGVVGGPSVVPLPPVTPPATSTTPPATAVALPPVPTPPVPTTPPTTAAPVVPVVTPPPVPPTTVAVATREPAPPVTAAPPVTSPEPPATAASTPRDTQRASTQQAASTPRRGRDEPTTTRTPASARATTRPTSSSEPDPRILAAYRRQAFPEAAQLARTQADGVTGRQRTALEQLARNIETFARRYPEARRGNFAAIEEAYRVDRRITGGDGAFGPELVPRLVGGYVSRARGSMASQPADACGDVRAALALQSSHPEARTLFRDCETRARRMLGEAQRLERSDASRARTIYGDIVSMLGGTHEVARDATARLVAMSRTTSTPSSTGPRRAPVDEDE